MYMLDKIIDFFKRLKEEKFTGDIRIHFNMGGVQGIKKVKEENIELK